MSLHRTAYQQSFTGRSTTRKPRDTKERPKDTTETPHQTEETAEIERGSWVSCERNADLQAPLGVPTVFVYAGAFDKVTHGAE